MVLDGDIFAPPHRKMLQRLASRTQDGDAQGCARYGGIAEVQTGQARAIGGYNLLQKGIEGICFGLAFPMLGGFVTRGAANGSHGGLG